MSKQRIIWPAIILLILGCGSIARAGTVFQTPTNWWVVNPSDTEDKTAEIQAAINNCRNNGGGTVYLGAGTYIVSSTLKVQTDFNIVGENLVMTSTGPTNIRILGAQPIAGHSIAAGESVIKWNGSSTTAAVLEVTHAQNTTFENLRITTFDASRRFQYGFFFHRIDSGITGSATLPAPTSVNIIDCGITKGPGSFTCGYRINDPLGDIIHPGDPAYSTDQNCDMNYVENLWIQGATDDNGGTTSNYQDGINSCGLWIDGSQVQAGYFKNINIDNCGTGAFIASGQLEVFGGSFSNNVQPAQGAAQCMSYDNHGSDTHSAVGVVNDIPSGYYATGPGGGDFVFRTGFGGGQLIQDVTRSGSYRFITGYYYNPNPDGNGNPSGANAWWQQPMPVALAVAHCTIASTAQPAGKVVLVRGNGGPIAFEQCNFGNTSGLAQLIRIEQWSQGSVVLSHCKFNHAAGNFYDLTPSGASSGENPEIALVNCQGWNGSSYVNLANNFSDPADSAYAEVTPAYLSSRSRSEKPAIPAYTVDLATFTYNGQTCNRINDDDPLQPNVYLYFDNAPIINAAIADVKAHGGGTVWFPSGSYVIRTPLRIEDATDVRLLGVGGRNGIRMPGPGIPINGSGITWDGSTSGTLLTINRSHNIVIEGFGFSTWYGEGQSGVTHFDTAIRISQTGSGGYPTENIWLEDIGVMYTSSNGAIRNSGICESFIRVGDGPATQNCNHITIMRQSANRCVQQVLLLDGPTCTDIQMMQFGGVQCKRVVRTTAAGGAFAWFAGGGGNNLFDWSTEVPSTYDDPVVCELEGATGPIYIVGQELQDNYPTRFFRTTNAAIDRETYPGAGQIYIYGMDWYFGAPKDDHKIIDFKFTGSGPNRPEIYAYGNACGWVYSTVYPGYDFALYTPRVAVANGASFFSLANLFAARSNPGPQLPWQMAHPGEGVIQDIGSRGYFADFSWPWALRNWKFYNSDQGAYSLAPYTVTHGVPFQVTWACANEGPIQGGDTNRNGDVELADLNLLAANWLATGLYWLNGDFTGEGEINLLDLALMGNNWLASSANRTGDYVALYDYPGTADAAYRARINLWDANSVYAPSGTTQGTLTAPAAGKYELRYFKNNTTKCVLRQALVVN